MVDKLIKKREINEDDIGGVLDELIVPINEEKEIHK